MKKEREAAASSVKLDPETGASAESVRSEVTDSVQPEVTDSVEPEVSESLGQNVIAPEVTNETAVVSEVAKAEVEEIEDNTKVEESAAKSKGGRGKKAILIPNITADTGSR